MNENVVARVLSREDMRIVREPDQAGFWLRRRGTNVELFEVVAVSDDDPLAMVAGLFVYSQDTERHFPVTLYGSPLTRWLGPLPAPPDWMRG